MSKLPKAQKRNSSQHKTGRRMAFVVVAIMILLSGFVLLKNIFLMRPNHIPSIFEAMEEATFLPRDFVFDFSVKNITGRGILQLNVGPRQFVLEDGWSRQFEWGIWGIGHESRIKIPPLKKESHLLYLECCPLKVPIKGLQQTIQVWVNENDCGKIELRPRWDKYFIIIPSASLLNDSNDIVLSYAYSLSSQELGTGTDTRQLAVRFKKIGIFAVSRHTDMSESDFIKNLEENLPDAERFKANSDRKRNTIIFNQPGKLVVPYHLPMNSDSLKFKLEGVTSLGTPYSFRIKIDDLHGRSEDLVVITSENIKNYSSSGSGLFRLPLGSFSGRFCLITFDLETPQKSQLKIVSPELKLQGKESYESKKDSSYYLSSDLSSFDKSNPDIVMIILDAARPDHFGCYGYTKNTTPNIDRLSNGCLLFNDAFTMAPYTLCSIPTMITGVSFADHGVIGHGQKLHSNVKTLAEYLHENGYLTIAFSATPNNSVSKGFDQGFDEFHEIWAGTKYSKNRRDPFWLSHRVKERLEKGIGEKPLYLQLHYVPPHEPYDPPPEFDIFGDDDYSGHYDGSHNTLRSIERGILVPQKSDLEEIISLYDGNLLRVDNAVELVLETLRKRKKWKETVILITSDHGEAFYEHGRMEHNTTLYDEMLRVPFILRIPEGHPSTEIKKEKMVSLADIVPTLLGLVNIKPESYVSGINILSQGTDRPDDMDRYLIARSGSEIAPYFSCRTQRWKIIINDARYQQLYDLENDPGETRNILYLRPVIFSGLMNVLYKELSRKQSDIFSVEKARMSKEEESMLRSLGYLK